MLAFVEKLCKESDQINENCKQSQKTLNSRYNPCNTTEEENKDVVYISSDQQMSFDDYKSKVIQSEVYRRLNYIHAKYPKWALSLLYLQHLLDVEDEEEVDHRPPFTLFRPFACEEKASTLSLVFYGHLKVFSRIIQPTQTFLFWVQTLLDFPSVLPVFSHENKVECDECDREILETVVKSIKSCLQNYVARAKAELFVCKKPILLSILDEHYPDCKPKLEQYILDRKDFPMTSEQKLFVYTTLKERNQLPDRYTPLSETSIYNSISLAFADMDTFVFDLLKLDKETHTYSVEPEEMELYHKVYKRICVDYYETPGMELTAAECYIKGQYFQYVQKRGTAGFEMRFDPISQESIKKKYYEHLSKIASEVHFNTGLCGDVSIMVSTYV